MTTIDQPRVGSRYAMNTQPSEIGTMASEGIRDLVKRATANVPIASYAETGLPALPWTTIAAAGWDLAGVVENGEGATALDLVAIAKEWGYGCIPLPLLPTLLAKRLSPAARESDNPVTFEIPFDGGTFIPFGETTGIELLSGLGDESAVLTDVPAGDPDALDIVGRSRITSATTTITKLGAREAALVFAGEAVGGAERLLSDAIAFAKDRQQFGRPVGSFQAVKHQLATATVAVESADTSLIWAAERPDKTFEAVLFAVDKCIDAAETAIQVHGGLGFTWEFGLHFPLRKMLSLRRIVEGLERSQSHRLV